MNGSTETIYEEIDDIYTTPEEDVFTKLLSEEKIYLDTLNEIVEDIKELQKETGDTKLFYFFGDINSILAYHVVEFLPDLDNCKSSDGIVNLFFKHKTLFHFYEDFIRKESYLPHVMGYKVTKKVHLIEENKSVVHKRLEEYIDFLEKFSETYNVDVERLKTAKSMLKNILEKATNDYEERFILCEMIATERRYMTNLKNNMEVYQKYVFDVDGAFFRKKQKIYGNLPQIYKQQKDLLESLEDSFFNLDILEIMDCFLDNQTCFEGYIGDQSLRCLDTIDLCSSKHPEIKSLINHTSDRLHKYVQFTGSLQKLFKNNPLAFKKILEVEKVIKDVISRVDSDIAISSIINENIDIGKHQGKLWSKNKFCITSNVDLISSRKEYMVFLFDKVVIITEDKIRNYRKQYEYVHHFLTKRLKLKIEDNIIILTDLKENKKEYYKLLIKEDDIFQSWAENITEILKEQLIQKKLQETSAKN